MLSTGTSQAHRPGITPGQGLPPQEFCALDYSDRTNFHSLETPTDERGLIDVHHLIREAADLVDPDYQWPGLPTIHHLYHPERNYPHIPNPGTVGNPHAFINLPPNKVFVPRQFENLIHWAFADPVPPSATIMGEQIEAWRVVRNLFKAASTTVRWERLQKQRRELIRTNPHILRSDFEGVDKIGEEFMNERLATHFHTYSHYLEELGRLTAAERLGITIPDQSSPNKVAGRIGSLVKRSHLVLIREVTGA